jgi:hypothetical protein
MLLIAISLAWMVVRWPVVALAIVIILAGLFGRTGAHWLVPGVELPALEVLLAAGSAAAVFLLGSRSASRGHVSIAPVLVWAPAAAWGILLVILFNHGDAISGLRDALVFLYPLLIALPLASIPHLAFRRTLERAIPLLIPLAFAVAAIGVSNLMSGHTSITSTGQTRALAGSFALPIVAGFLAALWMFQVRGWSIRKTLLAATPLGALLLVNHRSAYVGLIACVVVLGCMRIAPPLTVPRRIASVFTLLAIGGTLVLLLTPFGRAGVSRFASITQPNDPNITFRVAATENALHQEGVAQILGSGVGTMPTDLRAELTPTDPRGVHDSYAAAIQIGGALGLVALLVPMLWCCALIIKRRWDPVAQFLLPLSIFGMVMAAFNVTFENLYFSVWLWVPLIVGAILVCSERHARSDRHKDTPPA